MWGCVDSVNKCKDLDFPGFSHAQQEKYAEGFYNKSASGFDKVIASVDSMLVWTHCPTDEECDLANTGRAKFCCARKGKFSLNMQAACDAERRFLWVSIITPGTTSDYLSYITADLIKKLKKTWRAFTRSCFCWRQRVHQITRDGNSDKKCKSRFGE